MLITSQGNSHPRLKALVCLPHLLPLRTSIRQAEKTHTSAVCVSGAAEGQPSVGRREDCCCQGGGMAKMPVMCSEVWAMK